MDDLTTTTRRRLLCAAPAAAVAIAIPSTALAITDATAPEDADTYTREEYEAGQANGAEIAMFHVARAWVDRWEAIGGDFGFMFEQDGTARLTRGMRLDLEAWQHPDSERDDLPPHIKFRDDRHQDGAVRVLEGLLHLCPELHEAVCEIGGRKAWARFNRSVEA